MNKLPYEIVEKIYRYAELSVIDLRASYRPVIKPQKLVICKEFELEYNRIFRTESPCELLPWDRCYRFPEIIQFRRPEIEKSWDWSALSQNSNITWSPKWDTASQGLWEIVRDNPEKPWNYCELSHNPNITWKIVRDNPEMPWSYYWLTSNPNIAWEIVRDNPEKPWDCYGLITNPNIFNVDNVLIEKSTKYIACRKIQELWFECYYNPENVICKNRLLREFNDITQVMCLEKANK